jgi:hypothetical protein
MAIKLTRNAVPQTVAGSRTAVANTCLIHCSPRFREYNPPPKYLTTVHPMKAYVRLGFL